jgi:hypothetical protein
MGGTTLVLQIAIGFTAGYNKKKEYNQLKTHT